MARICVVRQDFYPLDVRIWREAEALAMAGHQVDVVCQRLPGEPAWERQGQVTVWRLPVPHQRGGLLRHFLQYVAFLVAAGGVVSALHLARRYQLVQVNSIPDTLVFAAFLPRLFGVPVLLDLHECMPEFFATRFRTGLSHPAVRTVAWLEQASIRFSHFAITCTEDMRRVFVSRGAPDDKIVVVHNGADEKVFDAGRHPPRPRDPQRFVLISHGTVEERYGLDTIVRAVALLHREIPGLRLEIYGTGSYLGELRRLAKTLGVDSHVYFSDGYVSFDELVRAIADADVGVVAMKRDIFRDLTHCNKMYEFVTMRKPTIVSRTRSVEAYYGDSCFEMFDSDDEEDLARAIRRLHRDPDLAALRVEQAAEVNEPYRWPHQRGVYLAVVEGLLAAPAEGREPGSGNGRRPPVVPAVRKGGGTPP